jgi:hypothetical protein
MLLDRFSKIDMIVVLAMVLLLAVLVYWHQLS